MPQGGTPDWRQWLLMGVTVFAVIVVFAQEPIAQDPAYHAFADRRTLFGVPNLLDVASNLPFLFFGIAGVAAIVNGPARGTLPELRAAYVIFFAGTALVGLGSGYYHLDPGNATLVWDRLPMTIAFMAFFAILLGEHFGAVLGRRALLPLLVIGPASVLYWWYSEAQGAGDLRAYGLVQFLPGLLIPLIMVLVPSRLTGTALIWGVLGTYVLAKLLEFLDAPIYAALGVSGHSLKHLAAAAGVLLFLVAVRTRRPRHPDR